MLKNFFKIALRSIFRQRAYAFINIAGLAIGISCCLLILSYVDDELSYDNFHPKTESTYRIALDRKFPDNQFIYARTPMPMGPALVRDIPEVESSMRMFKNFGGTGMLTFSHEDRFFDERNVFAVDSNFFDFFKVELLHGSADDALDLPNSLILTEAMAVKYFGSEDALGKQLQIENVGEMIVRGVAKPLPTNAHFHFDFLFSLSTIPPLYNNTFWGSYNAYNYIRLAEGQSIDALRTKMPEFIKGYMAPQIQQFLQISYEDYEGAGNAHDYFFQPLSDIHLTSNYQWEIEPNGNISTVYLFAGISVFILLIACINFMNLATARSANRAKEVGMRKVLGAVKKQLVFQFLTESVVMCFIALILAIGLTSVLLPSFNELSAKTISMQGFLSPLVIAAMVIFTILLGVISGLYPAFFLSAFRPIAVLKGKLQSGSKNSWLRNGLVIFQFSVSVILVIGTMVIYQQLQYMNEKQLGFDKDQLVIVERAGMLGNQSETYKNTLLENPNIISVTGTSTIPGRQVNGGTFTDVTSSDASERFLMPNITGDYDMIATMGLEMKEGRAFDSNIRTDTAAVIINESAARVFKWDNPINKQLQPINGPIFRVIGVVKDFHFQSLHQEIGPLALFANDLTRQPQPLMMVKVNNANIESTLKYMESKWADFVTQRPLTYNFVNQEFGALYEAEQRSGRIFTAFSSLAIVIACLGAFGLAAFLATQRTKEIGVRKVLGATTSGIVALLSKDFVKLILVANVIAWPIAYFGMQKWLESYAYAVGVDFTVFALATIGSVVIALLTVSYHSIRAATNNPADTLHHE